MIAGAALNTGLVIAGSTIFGLLLLAVAVSVIAAYWQSAMGHRGAHSFTATRTVHYSVGTAPVNTPRPTYPNDVRPQGDDWPSEDNYRLSDASPEEITAVLNVQYARDWGQDEQRRIRQHVRRMARRDILVKARVRFGGMR